MKTETALLEPRQTPDHPMTGSKFSVTNCNVIHRCNMSLKGYGTVYIIMGINAGKDLSRLSETAISKSAVKTAKN